MTKYKSDIPEGDSDCLQFDSCLDQIRAFCDESIVGRWSHCALIVRQVPRSSMPRCALYGVPSEVRLISAEGLADAARRIAVEYFRYAIDDWYICIRLTWVARYAACAAVIRFPVRGTPDDVCFGIWHLDSTARHRVKLGLGADASDLSAARTIIRDTHASSEISGDDSAALARALRASLPVQFIAGVGVLSFTVPSDPTLLWFGACRVDFQKVPLAGEVLQSAIRCSTLAMSGSRARSVYVLVLGDAEELAWRVTYDGEAALQLLNVTERLRVRADLTQRRHAPSNTRGRRRRS